jgi:hypothetical protein
MVQSLPGPRSCDPRSRPVDRGSTQARGCAMRPKCAATRWEGHKHLRKPSDRSATCRPWCEDVRKRGRVARAEPAGEGLDADLSHPVTLQHGLDCELRSDERAIRLEHNVLQHRAANHAQSGGDVSKWGSEEQTEESLVDPGDEDTQAGVDLLQDEAAGTEARRRVRIAATPGNAMSAAAVILNLAVAIGAAVRHPDRNSAIERDEGRVFHQASRHRTTKSIRARA